MTEAMRHRVELPARRFRLYPKDKDSGVEWLGMIPHHREVNRLNYLTSINDEVLPETSVLARRSLWDPKFLLRAYACCLRISAAMISGQKRRLD